MYWLITAYLKCMRSKVFWILDFFFIFGILAICIMRYVGNRTQDETKFMHASCTPYTNRLEEILCNFIHCRVYLHKPI